MGSNAFGGSIEVDIPTVDLAPAAEFNLISNTDAESFTLVGEVLPANGKWFTVQQFDEESVC